MTTRLYGNTTGLKASQATALERVYRRYIPREQVITPEVARTLVEVSREIGRQVGIIIDRRGSIQYVIIGDAGSLKIPDLGRIRAARSRLRGVRLVHTHLKGEPLAADDLGDLTLQSLDFIAVLDARPDANPLMMSGAWLLPLNPEQKQWDTLGPTPIHAFALDFELFIRELEAEFSRRAESFRCDDGVERAVLVHLDDGRNPDPDWEVEELRELALSANLQIVDVVRQRRRPDAKFFIGKGRLMDVVARAMQREVDLLVFCPDLSAAQVKAISDLAEIRVIDRTQLILDIFAQRAHSNDGKLQVELAQLRYLLPRFMGAGLAMSRLTGGIGARGPGESKLEADRRKVRKRIALLESRLDQLAVRRRERRKRRERGGLPIVSIVGYTNAGKSSLLNALTRADAFVENKLFATLDPYSKRLRFPRDREVILTDTVGFIRDLPKDLKAAFRATLEELESADLLLHVVDASSPRCEEQLASVERLLEDLSLSSVARLTVFNKVDLLRGSPVGVNLAQRYAGITISALDRDSLRPLVERMNTLLWDDGRTDTPHPIRPDNDETERSAHEEELRA